MHLTPTTLLLISLTAILIQSSMIVFADNLLILFKKSLHHKDTIGTHDYDSPKGTSENVGKMREMIEDIFSLKHYGPVKKWKVELQPIAYSAVDHKVLHDDMDVRNFGDQSTVVFVERGAAKALIKEDINGQTLCQHYVLSRPGEAMTVKEMSEIIEMPEKRKFSGKAYKIISKTSPTEVSLEENVEFEAEYIFIVKPRVRDQVLQTLSCNHAKAGEEEIENLKCKSPVNYLERVLKEE